MNMVQINKDTVSLLQPLAQEALSENYHFIQRTIDQWLDGSNDFSKKGEVFYAIIEDEIVVSVGGLNVDPYLNEPTTGRIRHVYTKIEYRRKGYSKRILQKILQDHTSSFQRIRLSTNNPIAARFYESLGFRRVEEEKATHQYLVPSNPF